MQYSTGNNHSTQSRVCRKLVAEGKRNKIGDKAQQTDRKLRRSYECVYRSVKSSSKSVCRWALSKQVYRITKAMNWMICPISTHMGIPLRRLAVMIARVLDWNLKLALGGGRSRFVCAWTKGVGPPPRVSIIHLISQPITFIRLTNIQYPYSYTLLVYLILFSLRSPINFISNFNSRTISVLSSSLFKVHGSLQSERLNGKYQMYPRNQWPKS